MLPNSFIAIEDNIPLCLSTLNTSSLPHGSLPKVAWNIDLVSPRVNGRKGKKKEARNRNESLQSQVSKGTGCQILSTRRGRHKVKAIPRERDYIQGLSPKREVSMRLTFKTVFHTLVRFTWQPPMQPLNLYSNVDYKKT